MLTAKRRNSARSSNLCGPNGEIVRRTRNEPSRRKAARRKLGNASLIREEVYEMNTLTFLEGLLRDARHALRMIRLNRAFSAGALGAGWEGLRANCWSRV